MKKALFMVLGMTLSLFLLVGCNNPKNTPKMKTEEFLTKYNDLSEDVLSDLNDSLEESSVDEDLLDRTKELYKKQYKDLKYKILKEKIDGDKATVKTKITVYDYAKAREEANKYMDEHNNEFMTDNVLDDVKFEKYVIEKQKETLETKDYTINIHLIKEGKEWKVKDLDNESLEKIHGTYSNES